MARIRGSSRLLAVLGDPVVHSLSPTMMNAAIGALGLDAVYVALRVPRNGLATGLAACAAARIAGNVTVPHKMTAATAMTALTDTARALGAANTFWPESDGLAGDNTDVDGFLDAVDTVEAEPPWLVCGTGGAARAVAAAAAARAVPLRVLSRRPDRAGVFCGWARALGADATPDTGAGVGTVINASPLGLAADDDTPVTAERAAGARAAIDLVYRPGETAWVRECRQLGLRAIDGRVMLVGQGARAFERFFPECAAPREIMRAAVAGALGS